MTKLCECGCGQPTPLATKTRRGNVKGQPTRYLHGHYFHATRERDYEVDEATGCWIWLHGKSGAGYGQLHVKHSRPRRMVYAHRVYYERHVGPVPDGLELDHLCRNPSCVNPEHLEPVTHAENIKRGWAAKNRGA